MDFVGGALPNVIFLVGVIAIGIGLGIEFKIVEVKGSLSRGGRIGAFTTGGLLIALSVLLYLRPTTASSPDSTPTPAAAVAAVSTQQPAATTEATAVPPTISAEPAAPVAATPVPSVLVPDLRGQNPKDVDRVLTSLGLVLGQQYHECLEIGVTGDGEIRTGKERIQCQSPQPGVGVALGTPIDYVVTGKGKD